jgi:hypothetical protein
VDLWFGVQAQEYLTLQAQFDLPWSHALLLQVLVVMLMGMGMVCQLAALLRVVSGGVQMCEQPPAPCWLQELHVHPPVPVLLARLVMLAVHQNSVQEAPLGSQG